MAVVRRVDETNLILRYIRLPFGHLDFVKWKTLKPVSVLFELNVIDENSELLKCHTLHTHKTQAVGNFFLFPKQEIHPKGKKFEDMDNITRHLTLQLLTMSKEKFRWCFNQWKYSME